MKSTSPSSFPGTDMDSDLPSGLPPYETRNSDFKAKGSLFVVLDAAVHELLLEHSCSPTYLAQTLLNSIVDIYAGELSRLTLCRARANREVMSESNSWINDGPSYLSGLLDPACDRTRELHSYASELHTKTVDDHHLHQEAIDNRARVISLRMTAALSSLIALRNVTTGTAAVAESDLLARCIQKSTDEDVDEVGFDRHRHILKYLIGLRNVTSQPNPPESRDENEIDPSCFSNLPIPDCEDDADF